MTAPATLTLPIMTTHAVPHGTCANCFQLIYFGLAHYCPTQLPVIATTLKLEEAK